MSRFRELLNASGPVMPPLIGDVDGVDSLFLQALRKLALEVGQTLEVTSGYRPETPDSEHAERLAVDIAVQDGSTRRKVVEAALRLEIPRIGVYDRHVHLGCSPRFPQSVLWVGVSR